MVVEVESRKETVEIAESFAKTTVEWTADLTLTIMLLEVIQAVVDHTMTMVNQPENPVVVEMEAMAEEEAVVEVLAAVEEEVVVVVVMEAEVQVVVEVVLKEEVEEVVDTEVPVAVVHLEEKAKEVSLIL